MSASPKQPAHPSATEAQPAPASAVRLLPSFIPIWVLYALLTYRFWFVCDDAYISFRYARNLAHGLGLRYNLGHQPPVEGFSNFLWTVACAAFQGIGVDVAMAATLTSFACGSLLLWLLYRTLHRHLLLPLPVAFVATLSLGLFPPFAVWSTGGLETMPFALLMFLLVEQLGLRQPRADRLGAALAAVGVVLIRTDGMAWAMLVAILVLAIALLTRDRRRAIDTLVVVVVVLVTFAVYLFWRHSYYGSWVSNTAVVKASFTGTTLIRGLKYVGAFTLAFLTPLMLLPASLAAMRPHARRASWLLIALLAWAGASYAAVVSGDWMAMGRLLVPVCCLFSAALLGRLLLVVWQNGSPARVAAMGAIAATTIAVALLPAFNLHVVPRDWQAVLHFRLNRGPDPQRDFPTEFEQWSFMADETEQLVTLGQVLAAHVQPGDTAVVGAIGAIGYFSDVFIYDLNGLVTPEVAQQANQGPLTRSPGHDKHVDYDFFLKDKPTLILPVLRPLPTEIVERNALRVAQSQLREWYVPEWYAVLDDEAGSPNESNAYAGETDRPSRPGGYVFVFRRIPEGTASHRAWLDVDANLRKLKRDYTVWAHQEETDKPAPTRRISPLRGTAP